MEENKSLDSRFQTLFGIETGLVFMLILCYFGSFGTLIEAIKTYSVYASSIPRMNYALVLNIIISCIYIIWTIVATILIVKKHKDALYTSKGLLIFYIAYNVVVLIISLINSDNVLTGSARIIGGIVFYGIFLAYLYTAKRLKVIFPNYPHSFMSGAFVTVMSAIPSLLFILGIIQDYSYSNMINIESNSMSINEEYHLQRNFTFDIPDGCECTTEKESSFGIEVTYYTISDQNGNSIMLYTLDDDEYTENNFIDTWNNLEEGLGDDFKQIGNDAPIRTKKWVKYDGRESQAMYNAIDYPDVTMHYTLCQLYNREISQICTVAFMEFTKEFDKETFINSIKY